MMNKEMKKRTLLKIYLDNSKKEKTWKLKKCLQKKIKNIENEIVELKNKEVIRIFKEFIENDYQNKYHVTIDVVLAALLGEHMKNIEVNKFAKFKKEYFENIKNIRFCEYRKKNDSK